MAYLSRSEKPMAYGHASSLEKSPPVRQPQFFPLCLLIARRCRIRGARLPWHAPASLTSDVGEQNPSYSLKNLALVIHRSSLGRLNGICWRRHAYLWSHYALTRAPSIAAHDICYSRRWTALNCAGCASISCVCTLRVRSGTSNTAVLSRSPFADSFKCSNSCFSYNRSRHLRI